MTSNAEVLQRSGLSNIGDLTYVIDASVWPCCTPGQYQHMMLCDSGYTDESRKAMASWRRRSCRGRPRYV